MPLNLQGRSLDSLLNYTTAEVQALVDLAITLKKEKQTGAARFKKPLVGKNIVLLFQKDSTRTRAAFEVAAADLGASVTYIGPSGSNFGNKESIEDTAQVLGRYYDGIQFRGFKQADVQKLVRYAGVPIWNGLTDEEHPTQTLADLMTMQEKLGTLKNRKLVFIGDITNNMGHSLLIGAAFMGMHIVLVAPAIYHSQMRPSVLEATKKLFAKNGGSLSFSDDKIKAAQHADVVYTDVWVSLGSPFELFESKIKLLENYQVDLEMMQNASQEAIFLHCLPAFHDDHTNFSSQIAKQFGNKFSVVKDGAMEVSNEVFQSHYNHSFDLAENRMHTIKAVILSTLGV